MATTKKKDEPEIPQATPETDAAAETGTDAAAEAEKILAQARAEAEKILADTKERANAPAQDAAPGEELVPIRLFKDNDKYKDDVFVAVNGERVQIKRGETVHIKRKFADVLEQSMRQDVATANMIERESASFEAKAAQLKI